VGTILALYTYPLSIPSIPAGKRAALLVLGKPIRNLKSGPAFVPFLIFSKEEFSSEAIQFEIPHDKELKERYTGKDHQNVVRVALRVPTGSKESTIFFPPVMLLTGDAEPTPEQRKVWKKQVAEKKERFDKAQETVEKDPLHVRYALEPTGLVRFSIEDPMSFVENVGDEIKAKIQMSEVFAAMVQEEFRKLTPAMITALLSDINESILGELESLTGEKRKEGRPWEKPWGINIESAKVTNVGLTETVNRPLAELAAAVTKAISDKKVAGEAKETKILEGEALGGYDKARLKGLGAGEKALYEGRAKGLQKMTEVANSSEAGKLVVQLDAMQKTVSPTAQVFLTGADLTTAVMGSVLAGKAPTLPPRQLPPPTPPVEKAEDSSS